jgi:DNA-binding NarL/FixJ family response regulator
MKLDSLQLLVTAREDMELSQEQYKVALALAIQDGYSNVKIARMLGISETAVRRYRKRHGL